MSLGDTLKSWRTGFMTNYGTTYKNAMLTLKQTFVYRSWEIRKCYREIFEELKNA